MGFIEAEDTAKFDSGQWEASDFLSTGEVEIGSEVRVLLRPSPLESFALRADLVHTPPRC
jgi:hypothetical protein